MSWIEISVPALAVGVVCFAALWPWSVWRRDASLVDVLWGPGFLIQLSVAAIAIGAVHLRGLLLLALVGLWSLRMGATLIGRRRREGEEDPRYQTLRHSWGAGFWWKSLFIVFLLQAVLQWLIALGPMAGMAAADVPLGWIGVLGAVVAVSGLALETVADWQLDRFKVSAAPDALMVTGLRAYVRHPNYSGEILFWSGVALVSVEAGAWLGLISPVLLTFFLTRVSGAPMLDERLSATRPGYAAYRARVPAFLPSSRQLLRA